MMLRRRLVIAALFLLVLVYGLWWSMRPRADQRFVGMWEREPHGDIFVFESSGHFTHLTKGQTPDCKGRWWVEKNQLIMRETPTGLFNFGVVTGLQRVTNYVLRRANFSAYDLFSVTDNVLHLKSESPGTGERQTVLARITELPPVPTKSRQLREAQAMRLP